MAASWLAEHAHNLRDDVEVTVRVNGLDTPWGRQDIARLADIPGLRAVVLPKVENVDALHDARMACERADAPSALQLWAMIETPRGIQEVDTIGNEGAQHLGLTALVAGTNDLSAELGCELGSPARHALQFSLARIVLAARAANISALDGVYNNVRDLAGFTEEALAARCLGFDGKTLLHPSTIEPANATFSPSGDQLDWARRVIAAVDAARESGDGIALLDGSILEELHVRKAHKFIALAQ